MKMTFLSCGCEAKVWLLVSIEVLVGRHDMSYKHLVIAGKACLGVTLSWQNLLMAAAGAHDAWLGRAACKARMAKKKSQLLCFQLQKTCKATWADSLIMQ